MYFCLQALRPPQAGLVVLRWASPGATFHGYESGHKAKVIPRLTIFGNITVQDIMTVTSREIYEASKPQ
jgi:hypothetical protein